MTPRPWQSSITSRAQPLELRHRGRLGHVEHVEQVVGDAATLGERQLRRTDVHAAVDLHRVGVHDLAAQPLGEVEGERALARRGRPDDGDHRATGCSARLDTAASLAKVPSGTPTGTRRRRHEERHSGFPGRREEEARRRRRQARRQDQRRPRQGRGRDRREDRRQAQRQDPHRRRTRPRTRSTTSTASATTSRRSSTPATPTGPSPTRRSDHGAVAASRRLRPGARPTPRPVPARAGRRPERGRSPEPGRPTGAAGE